MRTESGSKANWSGSLEYCARQMHFPERVEDVQELVSRSNRLKALGTRHSFSDIADTTGDLISLANFKRELVVDRVGGRVTVDGASSYGLVCGALHREGFALPNLASLPHICIAGAIATATHGSGDKNPILAAAVSAIEMVAANGEIVTLSRERDGDRFAGAVVGLGALGMVTRLTLSLVPAFEVRQDVFMDLPVEAVENHFDEVFASGYSVSLFTDWARPRFTQTWIKRLAAHGESAAPQTWLGVQRADRKLHPIPGFPSENCTQQQGVPGPWHTRIPHFRMEFTPSSGEELQSEYIVPRVHAMDAVRAILRVGSELAPHLQVSEVRSIAADDLWMSPCFCQDCVAFHFTWVKDWPAIRSVLPTLESALSPFGARPHWGKLTTTRLSQAACLYPRFADFRNLRQELDPGGKFRNRFLDELLG